jgi:hypothetical protein
MYRFGVCTTSAALAVGEAIAELMLDKDVWGPGRYVELLEELKAKAEIALKIDVKAKGVSQRDPVASDNSSIRSRQRSGKSVLQSKLTQTPKQRPDLLQSVRTQESPPGPPSPPPVSPPSPPPPSPGVLDTWINWVRACTACPNIPNGGSTNSTTVIVDFQSTATDTGLGSHVDLSVDNGSYVAVASPHTITGLSQAQHTIRLRGVTASGQVDTTPATWTFTVSAGGPPPPPPTGPPGPPPTGPPLPFPIPLAFQKTSRPFNTNFRFWNRYTTNYASGGSGPSLRWDNTDVTWRDMCAGFEFRIGPTHGSRGDDEVGLKFPRCVVPQRERGIYEASIDWFVDGSNSVGRVGSEWPHPTTSSRPFNADNPLPTIGNIKDGNWHGFIAVCWNDSQNRVHIEIWFNRNATGRIQDYVYLGQSIDSSNNIPPAPTLRYASAGHSGGTHPMQIRIDEIPASNSDRIGPTEWRHIGVRNMFACEVVRV